MAKSKGTELAKAYVQVIPSTKGISGKLGDVFKKDGDSAGKTFGSSLISKVKTIVAAAGIGAIIKKSLTEGADLQQSLGGIETLFKNSADKVKEHAQNAYKTTGMSANAYMETVTSFSASLLQGLSGDTNKAAQISNMAMIDMADNANKMGTSMDLIQNAYQGFAKQNYTMLDNLKLGYGGTKTEMERLLKDAQKISGVKYNINNLSDVYSAIHVIQQEMGITGTTAKEASATFSGSLSAMKAAASNVLGNLAIGENVGPSLKALGETVYTFAIDNLLPMVGNIVVGVGEAIVTTNWENVAKQLIGKLKNSIETSAREKLGTDGSIVDSVISAINARLPQVLDRGVNIITNLVTGILNTLPIVWNAAGDVLAKFVQCVFNNLPTIASSGVTLVLNLVNGIIKSLPSIVSSALTVCTKLNSTIVSNAPKLLEAGITLIGKLTAGLIKAVPSLIAQIPSIIKSIKNGFTSVNWSEVGKNIIAGIAKGIRNGLNEVVSAAKGVMSSSLSAVKKYLGIHSPSRVFEEQVGKMISFGLAEGIENNVSRVSSAMKKISDETVGFIDTNISVETRNVSSNVENIGSLFEILNQILVMLIQYFPLFSSMQLLLHNGVVAAELAPYMNYELGKIKENEERGR